MINLQERIAEIKELGYTVIPNVLTLRECENLKSICNKLDKSYSHKVANETSAQVFHGKNSVKMIYNLHNKDLNFLPLIDHPVALPLVMAALQDGSYANKEPIILKLSSARSPTDKAAAQQLHIDSQVPGTHVPLVMQVIFALDDFTETNGATRIVPGSHKSNQFAENNKVYETEKKLTAPAGSLIVYNGSVWHGSGEKTTTGDRWAIIMTYARWFMRPSFDHTQNTPYNVFEKLNPTQKELLGFKFNPPKDEFTRLSRRSADFEPPQEDYQLPHE